MTNTFRNKDLSKLLRIASGLLASGFEVSSVVAPENPYTDGVPYFHTNAGYHDILLAWRAA